MYSLTLTLHPPSPGQPLNYVPSVGSIRKDNRVAIGRPPDRSPAVSFSALVGQPVAVELTVTSPVAWSWAMHHRPACHLLCRLLRPRPASLPVHQLPRPSHQSTALSHQQPRLSLARQYSLKVPPALHLQGVVPQGVSTRTTPLSTASAIVPPVHPKRSFTIGALNAHSVGNKSKTINGTILEYQIDIFAVVESWHDGADSTSLIACTPSDYKYIELARPRTISTETKICGNFGGICVFYRKCLGVKIIKLPTYHNMEVLALSVRSSVFSTALITVYRPGSDTVKAEFFSEFADVLERCASFGSCIVVGDINVHLDCSADSATKHFMSVLHSFDMVDHVRQPTHTLHHQLDVFITCRDKPPNVMHVDPPLISDHSLITATYSVVAAGNDSHVRPRVLRHRWSALDIDQFIDDLETSDLVCSPPADDVDAYFDCYNSTLSNLIEKHVPAIYVTRYARPQSPWFDTECHLTKAKTRKLEKQYRKRPNAVTESAWRLQFRHQRILFESKYRHYWTFVIDSSAGNNRVLWTKLRCLLQPPADDSSHHEHSADDFANFFDGKIDKIRRSTAQAPPPAIASRDVAQKLSVFDPVTPEEVHRLIIASPAKQCSLDPIPTWLLKRVSCVLSPAIAAMCNASFKQHAVPASLKKAVVHPLLKKATMDPSDISSYRPISNLSFISKTMERVVSRRLAGHTNKQKLLPETQSAYRPNHSTETALVRIHNDIVHAVDRGDVAALVLLDLSAAFDTVDHTILIDVLRDRFGLQGDVLDWMTSYLEGRTQAVSVGSTLSSTRPLPCGVPQGSVLGPKQFIAYMEDVVPVFLNEGVSEHGYADDMQGLDHCLPAHIGTVTGNLQRSVTGVGGWCSSRRLQLNEQKTELIWFGTAANLRQLTPADKLLRIGNTVIQPSEVVRDLGVYFDSELSMHSHISRLTKNCFYQLRRLRPIRRQLGREVTRRLVAAFVFSRLDYCNAVLADLPAATLAPLQRVQNAAARLVLELRWNDHVTPALIELHWLPIKQRIVFKLCLLVHKSLNGRAPGYLSELLNPVSSFPERAALRAAAGNTLDVPGTRLRLGDRAFSVAGARHWNSLPANLRLITDNAVFKSQLKTHLFKIAFDLP